MVPAMIQMKMAKLHLIRLSLHGSSQAGNDEGAEMVSRYMAAFKATKCVVLSTGECWSIQHLHFFGLVRGAAPPTANPDRVRLQILTKSSRCTTTLQGLGPYLATFLSEHAVLLRVSMLHLRSVFMGTTHIACFGSGSKTGLHWPLECQGGYQAPRSC